MTATAETADYPIQTATARGHNPLFAAVPPSITETPLPSGTAGTFATLEAMSQCVRGEVPPDFSGYDDPWVRQCAEQITFGSSNDLQSVFGFVTEWIEYVPHPINAQVVQDCRRTIEIGSGDCVSMSVCVATLLASLGYQVRFVAQFPNDETQYSHVYTECFDRGRWIAIDSVAKDRPLGWSQNLPDGGFETTWEIF